MKFPQQVVIFGLSPLTLKDLDQDSRLIVRIGGEGLLFFGGDCGVTFHDFGHDT